MADVVELQRRERELLLPEHHEQKVRRGSVSVPESAVIVDVLDIADQVPDVLLAGSVSLRVALEQLATKRAVFHSEADFQHALAWTVQLLEPRVGVRLETHPEPNVQLSRFDLDRHTALELKYMTRGWVGSVAGEEFALKNHGAQDVRGHDVVKDIERVERFIEGKKRWNGAVVVLSNDPSYWRARAPGHDRETNAAAFRLHEGNLLEGLRHWGPATGAGTTSGREKPIQLRGRYRLAWMPYSAIDEPPTRLQALVVPIDRKEVAHDV